MVVNNFDCLLGLGFPKLIGVCCNSLEILPSCGNCELSYLICINTFFDCLMQWKCGTEYCIISLPICYMAS